MGAAYFIALDNPAPGFDPFVSGKAIAREAEGLSKVAASLGLKTPDEYFSMDAEDAASIADEFDVGEEVQAPAEQWFEIDEGLMWVGRLRAHLQSNPRAVKDAASVLTDLAEYERVLLQAKAVGARWHLSADF